MEGDIVAIAIGSDGDACAIADIVDSVINSLATGSVVDVAIGLGLKVSRIGRTDIVLSDDDETR